MCKKTENIWENNPELRPMAIANCKACTLSLKMRDCKSCKFQFALKVGVEYCISTKGDFYTLVKRKDGIITTFGLFDTPEQADVYVLKYLS